MNDAQLFLKRALARQYGLECSPALGHAFELASHLGRGSEADIRRHFHDIMVVGMEFWNEALTAADHAVLYERGSVTKDKMYWITQRLKIHPPKPGG